MLFRILLLVMLIVSGCNRPATVRPLSKPLMEAVYASGFVVSNNEYQVMAQTDGVLTRIAIPEGQPVKRGQTILELESETQNSRAEAARLAFEAARKNSSSNSPVLAELQATLATIQAKHRLDSINLIRYTNLWNARATTQLEYDRAKLTWQTSGNEVTAARNRLARTKADMQVAVEQAESQWIQSRQESDHTRVSSEMDGMVFQILKQPGEFVRRMEPVAVVGQTDSFHLRLAVDELDIKRVQVGQPALVRIDAYPGQIFHAVVSKIFPLVNTRQQSVQVEAELKDKLPALYSGLAVEANIVIREKKNAWVISKSLLLPGDSVRVMTPEGPKSLKVEKGIETLEEVEIVAGLSADSELLLPK